MLQNVLDKISSMQKLRIAGYPVHPLVLAGAGLAIAGGITALVAAKRRKHRRGEVRMVNTPENVPGASAF